MAGQIWELPGMTAEQRKAMMRGFLADLQDQIARNMALARSHREIDRPHMVRMYVQHARLQNRHICSELKLQHRLAMGIERPERPPRRAYVPKRPGETGYVEPPNPLAVLEVALAGGSAAEFVREHEEAQREELSAVANLVQGSLF